MSGELRVALVATVLGSCPTEITPPLI